MRHHIVWISLSLVAAAAPHGAPVGETFSMPDATLLFGNYNELRVVTPVQLLILNPPVDRGYNRGYFAIPSLSRRGDLVAWGYSTAWEEQRVTDRARFAIGLSPAFGPKWKSHGDFDSMGDAAFSPDGTKVAFVARQKGQRKLMLFDVATETFTTGPYQRGMPERSHLSWSPDGSRLATEIQRGDKPSVVGVIDLKSGEMRILGDGSNPRWSPTEDWIAYYNGERCVLVRADGSGLKAATSLTGSRNFGWGSPVWSPDGTQLLLNVTKGGGPLLDVVLLDLPTGRVTTKSTSGLPVFGWSTYRR